MQVTCFGLDWAVVEDHPDTDELVDEVIMSDTIDEHAHNLPRELWLSDSWSQHFEAAEELEALDGDVATHVRAVISTGESIDELGLSDLTDGCNFLSVSPDTVRELNTRFETFCGSADFAGLSDSTRKWISQWAGAFAHFASRDLGVIGHAG